MLSAGSQKPVLQWAVVESNPFTSTGRDFPVPQIHIEALEKGHIRSVLTWSQDCSSADTSGAPDPTPDSFILRQPGQTWNSICTGTAVRNLESNQTLKQVQIINDITFRRCKNIWLPETYCKVHFWGVFCQQLRYSASACSFPKWAF